MIVEFIGSTGAGKTTLVSMVQEKLAAITDATTSLRLVASLVGLKSVKSITAQNLLREIVGFPFFIRALHRYRPFLSFALRRLARQDNSVFLKLNYLRSLERKIGVEELIRRYNQERIVLVDEGMALAAFLTFGFSEADCTAAEVSEFARLIPLPDLMVYVRAPIETLVERTLQRPDPPRELREDPALANKYIRRAVALFEQLVAIGHISGRVLIVENAVTGQEALDLLAEQIAGFILDFRSDGSYV